MKTLSYETSSPQILINDSPTLLHIEIEPKNEDIKNLKEHQNNIKVNGFFKSLKKQSIIKNSFDKEETSQKRKKIKNKSFLSFKKQKNVKSDEEKTINQNSVQQRKSIINQKLEDCLQRIEPTSFINQEKHIKIQESYPFDNLIERKFIIGGILLYVYQQNNIPYNHIKYIFVTIHDIAHTFESNFKKLFSDQYFNSVTKKCSIIYHVCLPGQEPNCSNVISNYPGFSELSKIITVLIADNLKIDKCIGVGVGAGADLLIRSSLLAPSLYKHLILVNLKLRVLDKFKIVKYPFVFNPINNTLSDYGMNYFESRCTKSYCASLVNIESIKNYKKTLLTLKSNLNFSQLVYQYWKRPDLNYYVDEAFKKHELVPKILLKPNVLLFEGLVNPSKNTRGDILDFVYPNTRIYRSFENGSRLVLDEYTEQIAHDILQFTQIFN